MHHHLSFVSKPNHISSTFFQKYDLAEIYNFILLSAYSLKLMRTTHMGDLRFTNVQHSKFTFSRTNLVLLALILD